MALSFGSARVFSPGAAHCEDACFGTATQHQDSRQAPRVTNEVRIVELIAVNDHNSARSVSRTSSGRVSGETSASGRDASGRDASGRDASDRDASGRDASG